MPFSISDILGSFRNLDLVAVAVSVAAIGIMGIAVYSSDRRSATNRAFLLFAMFTIAYSAANYFSYRFTDPFRILWMLRLTLFAATWHAFSFFHLFFVFPRTEVHYPRWYLFGLLPVTAATSLLTLSSYVFERIEVVAAAGNVTNPVRGIGMPVFAAVAAVLVVLGLILLIRKTVGPASEQRSQSRIVLTGAVMTFSLLLTFNVLLPVAFDVLWFIPLAPVFFLPFILGSSHAIQRYHFLNVKVIGAELLTFLLAVITLAEVVVADDVGILVLRIGTFLLVLAFGILLVRSVVREVEQREHLEQMTRELTDANIQLKRLDRIRSEFLSFASHQVKAPMSVVKGYAQLIGDGTYGTVPDKVKETAMRIKESADILISLVNNLLDLRRLEEGRMQFSFESADITALAARVTDDIKPLAEKKGLELSYSGPSKPLMVQMDTEKFRQVITNLIDNAIKYTEKGWVRVSTATEGSDVVLSITDSGRGMPRDIIPQLFEQFTRERDAAKRIEGTGLGLYIAKQIVLAHKGTVTASSEGPGKGSTFTVILPATQAQT